MRNLKESLNSLQETARERTVKTQDIEYDLETLIKRLKNNTIKLNPEYQRRHRWSDDVSSRLIESLLLNIPIPVVFISQDIDVDEETEERVARYTVIDGQQRLTAIRDFMTGDLELTGLEVLKDLNGSRIRDLPPFLMRRLEDRTIRCLRIDSTLDPQVKYDIFERLNTGSVRLEPQELRNAVARGPFNDLIKVLATYNDFRILLQIPIKDPETSPKVKKMEDMELVLRYFALRGGAYNESRSTGFKEFLTLKMNEFNSLDRDVLQAMGREFKFCTSAIRNKLGDLAFSKHRVEHGASVKRMSSFNAAVYDAIMIGFNDVNDVEKLLESLTTDASFSFEGVNFISEDQRLSLFENSVFFEAVSGSVNDSGKIRTRINAVIDMAN